MNRDYGKNSVLDVDFAKSLHSTHQILVSRYWNNPKIMISVTDEEIGIRISLNEFLAIMAQEIGNPSMIVTKSALLSKMRDAAGKITENMKKETERIIVR
jgi:hypothetical protein